ncbi:MAG: hypothetical protein C0392_14535 [Syntrophus sp. (in: bacteria)]|nr:hypothetical protein [Syntrophus sp. (in: bacteria)]
MRTDLVISNPSNIRGRFPVIEKSVSEFTPSTTSIEVIRRRSADILPFFSIKDPPLYYTVPFHAVGDNYKSPFTYAMTYYDSAAKKNSRYPDKGMHISIYA